MLDYERQGCSQPCRHVFRSDGVCESWIHVRGSRLRLGANCWGLPSDRRRVVVTGFSLVYGQLGTVVSFVLESKERVVQFTHSWVSDLPNSQAIACLQCIVALGANGATIIGHAHFHWHSVHGAG